MIRVICEGAKDVQSDNLHSLLHQISWSNLEHTRRFLSGPSQSGIVAINLYY